jgi:hypothetical protein
LIVEFQKDIYYCVTKVIQILNETMHTWVFITWDKFFPFIIHLYAWWAKGVFIHPCAWWTKFQRTPCMHHMHTMCEEREIAWKWTITMHTWCDYVLLDELDMPYFYNDLDKSWSNPGLLDNYPQCKTHAYYKDKVPCISLIQRNKIHLRKMMLSHILEQLAFYFIHDSHLQKLKSLMRQQRKLLKNYFI